jgi:ribosomal protein L24
MQKIQTWDLVIVTTGQFKWKTAKVVKVSEKWVYLEGLNMKKRAKKWQWYIDVHHAIDYSNVQYFDGNWASRINIDVVDWKKQRVVKNTGKPVTK